MERLMPLEKFITFSERREHNTAHKALAIYWDGQKAEDKSKQKVQTTAFTGVSEGRQGRTE